MPHESEDADLSISCVRCHLAAEANLLKSESFDRKLLHNGEVEGHKEIFQKMVFLFHCSSSLYSVVKAFSFEQNVTMSYNLIAYGALF